MAEDIRFERATAADYDEIVEFANFVFSYAHEPHEFKTLISKAYGEDRTHWPIHFVARENGRIRGLVGLMPFPQRVLGETLQMGFIGTVSVHPYSRSKGYMKKLMAMTNDYARDNGFDLLALGRQRQRYEYYGYEPGGRHARPDHYRHQLPPRAERCGSGRRLFCSLRKPARANGRAIFDL